MQEKISLMPRKIALINRKNSWNKWKILRLALFSLKIAVILEKNEARKRNFAIDFEQNWVKNSLSDKEIT